MRASYALTLDLGTNAFRPDICPAFEKHQSVGVDHKRWHFLVLHPQKETHFDDYGVT